MREITSKVQTMRKEAGFDVTDHITLCIMGNDKLETLLRKNEAAVSGDVLADEIVYGRTDGYEKEWDINGEKATLAVAKR